MCHLNRWHTIVYIVNNVIFVPNGNDILYSGTCSSIARQDKISGVLKSTVIFYYIFNVILSRLFLASEYCCELAAKIMRTFVTLIVPIH